MSFEKMMDSKNSELEIVEDQLKRIPRGKAVLIKRIEEERDLLDAGLVAGLNDRSPLVELEVELTELNKKEFDLKTRVTELNIEIEDLRNNEKRLKRIEEAIEYFKTLKKFADWKVKQIEKNRNNKEMVREYPSEEIINTLAKSKQNPLVRGALPF